MVRTMGDASGVFSVYNGPDVGTSLSQAQGAAGRAGSDAAVAAQNAAIAASSGSIAACQAASNAAQAAASDALVQAAGAVAAANNAGLAMNAQATVIANSYSPVVPDNTVVNGTVTSTHTGGGH